MSTTTVSTLLTQLQMCHWAAHRNLDGITHEESLFTPEHGGNSLNWLLGHLVTTRCLFLPMVGAEPVWTAEEMAAYRRGTNGRATESFRPFEEIVRAYDQSQERLIAALEAASPETLAGKAAFSPSGDPEETVASLAARIAFHEGYHLGQTAIVRRVMGKPGAIQ